MQRIGKRIFRAGTGSGHSLLLKRRESASRSSKSEILRICKRLYDGRNSALVQPGQVLKLLCARIISKRPATVFVKASPNGYLIKASSFHQPRWPRAAQWPHYQAPMAILSKPAQFGHFVKSNPIAILSKPAPMAILLSKSNGKFIKDSPKATSSRQPQWLFYQSKWPSHQSQLPLYQSQWPFYQSRLPRQFIKASPSGNFMTVERSP